MGCKGLTRKTRLVKNGAAIEKKATAKEKRDLKRLEREEQIKKLTEILKNKRK